MVELLLSASALILFIFLIMVRKWSLLSAAACAYAINAILLNNIWLMDTNKFLGANAKGILIAFDIFIIIAGALFFLDTLRKGGVIESLVYYLQSISPDYRVQVVLIAWFLGSFIEGTAGFGTPTVIAAPILVAMGFSPITAVVISLFGNSASVAFGAAGTPIRVGLAGLPLEGVPFWAATINFIGILVPVFMIWIASKEKGGKREFREALPFALISGVAFVGFSLLFVPLGIEMPSILGAVAGVLLILLLNRFKIFIPKRVVKCSVDKPKTLVPLRKVLAPYLTLIILLIVGKFLLKGGVSVSLLGNISHTIAFYNPGIILIISALPFAIWWKVRPSLKRASQAALTPFLVTMFMSAMVQTMLFSNINITGKESMIKAISHPFTNFALPFTAPIFGVLGSFVTGSATVANILFGQIAYEGSLAEGFNSAIILALLLVGGAAGNMIALADMLTAQSVVGLKNKEREIIKQIIYPCLIYMVMAGILGAVLVTFVKP